MLSTRFKLVSVLFLVLSLCFEAKSVPLRSHVTSGLEASEASLRQHRILELARKSIESKYWTTDSESAAIIRLKYLSKLSPADISNAVQIPQKTIDTFLESYEVSEAIVSYVEQSNYLEDNGESNFDWVVETWNSRAGPVCRILDAYTKSKIQNKEHRVEEVADVTSESFPLIEKVVHMFNEYIESITEKKEEKNELPVELDGEKREETDESLKAVSTPIRPAERHQLEKKPSNPTKKRGRALFQEEPVPNKRARPVKPTYSDEAIPEADARTISDSGSHFSNDLPPNYQQRDVDEESRDEYNSFYRPVYRSLYQPRFESLFQRSASDKFGGF